MLPVLSLAMENNISAFKLSKLIFSYPTKSELIKKVADSFVI
jgi:pyruvate/2-oxoglutarate dehydrogenase complex dihydrolipoamide dehydrogenase (E3) component